MTLSDLIFTLQIMSVKYGKNMPVKVLEEGEEPHTADIVDIYEQHNEITLIIKP